MLLQEGIGDTIRVSLTPAPDGDRTEEVRVGQQILQSLGIRSFTPQVTACPGCGRTTSTFFQEMAEQIQTYLREQMPVWKERYPGVEEMKVAVMGCVVNGPGESKHANIGISLPGTFEEPKAPVYVDGRLLTTLKGDNIVAEFIRFWTSTWNRTTPRRKKKQLRFRSTFHFAISPRQEISSPFCLPIPATPLKAILRLAKGIVEGLQKQNDPASKSRGHYRRLGRP